MLKDTRILAVEDNPVNQMVISEILLSGGIAVESVDSGIKALELLKKNDYDAVLMDVQMPDMDGLETTKRIRRDLKMADLPIIAMTAHAMRGDRERCIEAGMDDYVSKPVEREQIFAVLHKNIKRTIVTAEVSSASPVGRMWRPE